MEITRVKLQLVKQAKAKGGDRYEAVLVKNENPTAIYLPQIITRSDSVPFKEIEMILNTLED